MEEHGERDIANPFCFDKMGLCVKVVMHGELTEVSREVRAAGHQDLSIAIIKSRRRKGHGGHTGENEARFHGNEERIHQVLVH